MLDERVGGRAILHGKCPGRGRVGCEIKREVKNTENGVEAGRRCLEGSCENPWVTQGLVAMAEHPSSFGRDQPVVEPGASKDFGLLLFFLCKKETSALATAAGLTVMSLMNVAQGMFQVEGEMWDFLCV